MDETQKIKTCFGSKVRKLRLEKGLTQLDLASKVGIDVRQIKRIESGQTNTSISTAYLLTKALNVSLDAMFEER